MKKQGMHRVVHLVELVGRWPTNKVPIQHGPRWFAMGWDRTGLDGTGRTGPVQKDRVPRPRMRAGRTPRGRVQVGQTRQQCHAYGRIGFSVMMMMIPGQVLLLLLLLVLHTLLPVRSQGDLIFGHVSLVNSMEQGPRCLAGGVADNKTAT
jgi:hypothetical protein